MRKKNFNHRNVSSHCLFSRRSVNFVSFLANCLVKSPNDRSMASQLLQVYWLYTECVVYVCLPKSDPGRNLFAFLEATLYLRIYHCRVEVYIGLDINGPPDKISNEHDPISERRKPDDPNPTWQWIPGPQPEFYSKNASILQFELYNLNITELCQL